MMDLLAGDLFTTGSRRARTTTGNDSMTLGSTSKTASDVEDSHLDSADTAYLAPMGREELRSQFGAEVFTKRPLLFSAKLLGGLAPVVAATAYSTTRRTPMARLLAIGVNGLFFAHLLELQHECLHEHAYRSRRANRLAGLVCGAPTLSSYSHYKYEHLRHHAFLGTPENREFFQYSDKGLDSVSGFVGTAFNLGRYGAVAENVLRAVRGKGPRGVDKKKSARRSRREYLGFGAAVALAAVALVDRRHRAAVLCHWWVPALVVSEPVHFLIELPEHFGLAASSDPDVLENSRTVHAGRVARWFTNGNDLHTAHHVHQGVPMENIQSVQDVISPAVKHTARSYPAFYADVISGRITAWVEPTYS